MPNKQDSRQRAANAPSGPSDHNSLLPIFGSLTSLENHVFDGRLNRHLAPRGRGGSGNRYAGKP
jgi:hypothetical protein